MVPFSCSLTAILDILNAFLVHSNLRSYGFSGLKPGNLLDRKTHRFLLRIFLSIKDIKTGEYRGKKQLIRAQRKLILQQ